jgi:hypothetical protein
MIFSTRSGANCLEILKSCVCLPRIVGAKGGVLAGLLVVMQEEADTCVGMPAVFQIVNRAREFFEGFQESSGPPPQEGKHKSGLEGEGGEEAKKDPMGVDVDDEKLFELASEAASSQECKPALAGAGLWRMVIGGSAR